MAPHTKQKASKGKAAKTGANITDPRFANIQTDPRFRLPSRKHKKITLDSRFADVLKDEEFSRKATVDRYGRKISKSAGKKDLARLYSLEGEDSDEEEGSEDVDEDGDVQKELSRIDKSYDPARGGGFSSSEEDSDEEDEEEEVEDEAELAGEAVQDDVPMGEVSSRLAAVNLDWDNIRAVDLMAVANSFVPGDGRIHDVTIYPSEFGRERLEREELEGPPAEIFAASKAAKNDDSDEDSESENEKIKKSLIAEDQGDEFDSSALRAYQLDRLRYYYAVITCSSPAVGQALYDAMDGREYLSSANFFDLRFIPDDVSFDTDKPHDRCTSIPDGYKPNDFVTDALTHSKVKLTWDAEDTTRKEAQKRAFSRAEIDENDLKAYIGSDSSSEDEEEEEELDDAALDPGSTAKPTTRKPQTNKKSEKASALRAALGLSGSSAPSKSKKREPAAPVGDMEITFTPGLSASSGKGRKSVFENAPPAKDETTIEKYKRKEKERKERRRERAQMAREGKDPDAEMLSASEDEEDGGVLVEWGDDKEDTSKSKSNSKSKSKSKPTTTDAPPEDLGFNDPFFAADSPTTKPAKSKKSKPTKPKHAPAQPDPALSLPLAPEMGTTDTHLQHFSMPAILRAEKLARRGGAKLHKHQKAAKVDSTGLQEDFEMDVRDPRFASLYESAEFAIDPTSARFSGSRGMRALLEEGRRRRGDGGEEEEGKRKRGGTGEKEEGGREEEELGRLVERVKKRVKA